MGDVRLLLGDCTELLPTLDAESADAVVTDPPAGIGFMNKAFDSDRGGRTQWVAWLADIMGWCLRALKPGGYALVWALPRTSHWTACALEDAGLDIRDRISHIFGQGFPKGKGCLKPAVEDWWLCRKPGPRVLPLGVEECRVAGQIEPTRFDPSIHRHDGWRMDMTGAESAARSSPAGRWPPNLVLSCYCDNKEKHDSSCPVRLLDEQSGERPSRPAKVLRRGQTTGQSLGYRGQKGVQIAPGTVDDTGGASRFFPQFGSTDADDVPFLYCPKASRSEREAGLEGMPQEARNGEDYRRKINTSKQSDDGLRGDVPRANTHPTVKPVALCEWLCRLISREGQTVLDPFTGSGSIGVACIRTGRKFIGIEKESEYLEIARRRIAHAERQLRDDAPLFQESP